MRLSHRDTSVMYLWTLLFISSFSCTAVSNSIEISCESAKQKEPVLALVTSNTSFGVEETRGKRLLCYFHVFLWLTLACARVCVVCTGVQVKNSCAQVESKGGCQAPFFTTLPISSRAGPSLKVKFPISARLAGQQAPESWCLWPQTLGDRQPCQAFMWEQGIWTLNPFLHFTASIPSH